MELPKIKAQKAMELGLNMALQKKLKIKEKVKNDFISNPPIRSLNPHFAYKTIPVEDKIGFPYLVMSL